MRQVRVNFGKFFCEKHLVNFTLPMIPSYHVFLLEFLCLELGYTGLSVYLLILVILILVNFLKNL